MQPCSCKNTPKNEVTIQKSINNKPPLKSIKYLIRYFSIAALLLTLWTIAYMSTAYIARWIRSDIFQLPEGNFANAVEFFIYDSSKILLLLVLMVYVIAWLRASIQTERIRDYLTGKRRAVGYGLGSVLGAVTPFCSCSSIPLFLAFNNARIPLGVTMSFLITSPLINEVAIILLWGLLGWEFTLMYIGVGLFAGILGGIIMDLIGAERWLKPFVLEEQNTPQMMAITIKTPKISFQQRHIFARKETTKILQNIWVWVIIGVAVGATLHGYVPDEWFAQNLGVGQWWSVPLAVLVGIPLYTNATGIIPIMESLLIKGLPLGTTLAFCMSAVAASLPEILILKQVMRWQLLAVFIGILLVLFTLVGWLFNIFSFGL